MLTIIAIKLAFADDPVTALQFMTMIGIDVISLTIGAVLGRLTAN